MKGNTTTSVTTLLVLLMFVTPAFAGTAGIAISSISHVRVHSTVSLLDPSFNPNAAVGGVPFCFSGGLGTILCYTPSFLKSAYHFPASTGIGGLDGTGQTIVIVDAFGSPTIQSDLNKFDTAFGLPPTTVTILCGPSFTGASSDTCPAFVPGSPADQACGELGWAEETTLDVTLSHGLAPGAKIVLVAANSCFDQDLTAAELAVVQQKSLKGSIMSQSFGEPDTVVGCIDFPQCTQIDPTIKANQDHVYSIAKQNHWTVLASSGDDGANENVRFAGTTELIPSWPSTNPLVLSAGGTQGNPYGGQYGGPPGPGNTFSCAANTNCNTGLVVINGGANGCGTAARPGVPTSCTPVGYGGEAAWNEFANFGIATSTGGGVSSLYGRPFYQQGLPASFSTLLGSSVSASGRLTPDISFNAAIHGGVLAFLGMLHLFPHQGADRWAVFGGTSASSPALAAILALEGQYISNTQGQGNFLGYINPAIYQLGHSSTYARDFHDVIVGNNSDTGGQFGVDGYSASPGYDLTTGWGTPNVANFITDLAVAVQNHP